MKSFKLTAALIIAAVLFCSCQSAPSEPPEEPTAATAEATVTSPVTNEYVSAAKSDVFTYNDGSGTHEVSYSVPQLDIKTKDARRINEDIARVYTEDFAKAAEQQQKNAAPELASISYQANLNDDIITLLILREAQNHSVTYGVYNYNIKTEEWLDNNGLLMYLQRDVDQAYADLKEALESDYYSKFSYEDFPDDYYYQLDLTAGDEAVRSSRLFLNESGILYAVCTEHASVGGGEFEVIIKL